MSASWERKIMQLMGSYSKLGEIAQQNDIVRNAKERIDYTINHLISGLMRECDDIINQFAESMHKGEYGWIECNTFWLNIKANMHGLYAIQYESVKDTVKYTQTQVMYCNESSQWFTDYVYIKAYLKLPPLPNE